MKHGKYVGVHGESRRDVYAKKKDPVILYPAVRRTMWRLGLRCRWSPDRIQTTIETRLFRTFAIVNRHTGDHNSSNIS
jgi:hypothetical protein